MTKPIFTWRNHSINIIDDMVCPKCGSHNVELDIVDMTVNDFGFVEQIGYCDCRECNSALDFTAYFKIDRIEFF